MTADEFKAGIRDAIETAIKEQAWTLDCGAGELTVDGDVDTTELADAVHEFVVDTLSPLFAPQEDK